MSFLITDRSLIVLRRRFERSEGFTIDIDLKACKLVSLCEKNTISKCEEKLMIDNYSEQAMSRMCVLNDESSLGDLSY